MNKPTVAIIGSFKQHYSIILHHVSVFKSYGVHVTTPVGSKILEPNIPFVRFESDCHQYSDSMIQTITLRKIFNSDVVYVVAPNGYIGRTTCYEIGRIVQRKQPLYFSDKPFDIPIEFPLSHIVDSVALCETINSNKLSWPFSQILTDYEIAENELLTII